MIKIVEMNEVGISSEEYPIIGTVALSTCLGILLYEENSKIAIVAHCTSDWIPIVLKMLNLIDDSKPRVFKYLIIPGYYMDNYDTINKINKFFLRFSNEKLTFIPYQQEYKSYLIFDKKTLSYEFMFDANTGNFITENEKICYNFRGNNYGGNTYK